MSEYVENGYMESGYIEGDEISSSDPVSCEVDLTSVLSELELIKSQNLSILEKLNDYGVSSVYLSSLSQQYSNLLNLISNYDCSSVDLTSVENSVSLIKSDIDTIKDYISLNPLQSLNGNGSEYIDGTLVTVIGRDVVYTVERSFINLYSDNSYTVHYDLVSDDGYKCTVPEALLTKYVEAV